MTDAMIDLKKLADRKYKIRLDESYEAEQGGKEWYYQIPSLGKHHIYVHGKKLLGVYVFGSRMIAKMKSISGIRTHQAGDKEATFLFDPKILDKVAEAIGARRSRPKLSDEQRAACSERLAPFRFQKPRTSDAV